MWAVTHENDFHTKPGTEINTYTEYGKPASASFGPLIEGAMHSLGYQIKGDANRVMADLTKCFNDISELGWTNHQDYLNILYGLHNDCEARNAEVTSLIANTKATEYMHNLLNICDLKYEWELVDANRPAVAAKFEEVVAGPELINKGISDINQWITDSKVHKDKTYYDNGLKFDEEMKESFRVLDGEEKNAGGRAKFHNDFEQNFADYKSKAHDRFLNEPSAQWYSELESQVYENEY